MSGYCESPSTPVEVCAEKAEYVTRVQTPEIGIFQDGPKLCGAHLGPRIASLLGRHLTVVVGKING